jgi:hypothetical protein
MNHVARDAPSARNNFIIDSMSDGVFRRYEPGSIQIAARSMDEMCQSRNVKPALPSLSVVFAGMLFFFRPHN